MIGGYRVVSLVDTNILVYRSDASDPIKRDMARDLLRNGSAKHELLIPHQALFEFVNVVTRRRGVRDPLLPREEAWRQAEDYINEFPVLYPNESVFRTALLGMAAYRLPWYDAHLWAYAEHYGVPELLSEDFEHGRWYGTVRVRNPFGGFGLGEGDVAAFCPRNLFLEFILTASRKLQTFSDSRSPVFQTALLEWYDRHARVLPWRENRDPYRVWVSEIMLQQTRVAAVIAHYCEFLRRFPTVEKLAAAREASVLAAWSGLGYYRRARMLHAAAKVVARDLDENFPSTAEGWRALPGIGRYTAAAIASIAFGEAVAVVDGNVERVLHRISGKQLESELLWNAAEELLD